MNLQDKLFPDTNITGFTDTRNQPIMVGQKVKDETGVVWYVLLDGYAHVVALEPTLDNPNTQRIPLNLFVTMSQSFEIVT